MMKIFGRQIHIGLLQLGAYLAIVTVAAVAFAGFQQTQDELCHRASQNQVAMRALVEAVVSLQNDLIQDHVTDHPDSVEHKLDEVQKFRTIALEALDSQACEEN